MEVDVRVCGVGAVAPATVLFMTAATLAFAPTAQARIASTLTADVGCSTTTLGRGAAVTSTPPFYTRIHLTGGLSGLTPGAGYTYVWPGAPDPNATAFLGTADADGVIRLDNLAVDLAEQVAGSTPKPFELHDAEGASVGSGATPLVVRSGSQCRALGALVAQPASPDPTGIDVFRLVQQTDGNVVERNGQGRALWSTRTAGNPGARTHLQADGNVVTRDTSGRAIWTTNTAGHAGATLSVQTDSNIVVRDASGRVLWASGIHR